MFIIIMMYELSIITTYYEESYEYIYQLEIYKIYIYINLYFE